MTSRPTVPRPSTRDTGHLSSRWDTSRPTAGTNSAHGFNTWQKSEKISSDEWDSICPTAAPDEENNCPTLPLPSVALGQPALVPWTVSDWLAFYDERLAIAHFEGGLSLQDASRLAWLTCIQCWLERHPPPNVAPLVWPAETLRLARISEAIHALTNLGISDQCGD
jgi:hypothetical protein